MAPNDTIIILIVGTVNDTAGISGYSLHKVTKPWELTAFPSSLLLHTDKSHEHKNTLNMFDENIEWFPKVGGESVIVKLNNLTGRKNVNACSKIQLNRNELHEAYKFILELYLSLHPLTLTEYESAYFQSPITTNELSFSDVLYNLFTLFSLYIVYDTSGSLWYIWLLSLYQQHWFTWLVSLGGLVVLIWQCMELVIIKNFSIICYR